MAASYRLSKAELKVAEDEATAKANEAHELGSDLWQESYDAALRGATKRIKEDKYSRRQRRSTGGAAGSADSDGGGGEAAAPGLPAVPPSWPGKAEINTNESYLADVEAAVQVILGHVIFRNMICQDPLPITEDLNTTSGVQSVFDASQCKVALMREKKYICSGNFWWQNMLASATPGVPLRKERVVELGRYMFHIDPESGVNPLPHMLGMITVLVESPDVDILAHKGALMRVSPEELVHAAIFICADEVTANVPEERLQRWKSIFLSCCFCFEVADPGQDTCYWKAYNLRQTIVATYGGCKRSAKQMAHEIFLYKKLKEAETGTTLNRKQVAQLYQQKGKTARDSEPVSENYVNTALNVFEKICSLPALARCIDTLEARFGLASCLNNMTSLAIVITRTDDASMRKWTLESITDSVLAGLLQNDDVTKTVLGGSHNVTSLCTLLQFRRQVLNRYLHVDLPQLGVHFVDLETFRTALADHDTYRRTVRGMNQAVDTTWKARCKQSSLLALELLEDCVGTGWR
jgi:hypothetical protein